MEIFIFDDMTTDRRWNYELSSSPLCSSIQFIPEASLIRSCHYAIEHRLILSSTCYFSRSPAQMVKRIFFLSHPVKRWYQDNRLQKYSAIELDGVIYLSIFYFIFRTLTLQPEQEQQIKKSLFAASLPHTHLLITSPRSRLCVYPFLVILILFGASSGVKGPPIAYGNKWESRRVRKISAMPCWP